MSETSTSLEALVCQNKTKEAIERLKTLIEDLYGEPRNNLISLLGRRVSNDKGQLAETVRKEEFDIESNRIASYFLAILSQVREEIQNNINFYKPIPRASEEREILRDFIHTTLSKKFKNIQPFSEGQSFIYFSGVERNSELEVMVMILKSSDVHGLKQYSQLNKIAQLKHRNLIQLLEVNFQTYPYHIITEYVKGINLKTLMTNTGAFPLHNAKRLLLIIGDVMNYLKQKKFINAGIRPSKIIIDHELEPEISPFDILLVNQDRRLLKSFIEDAHYFAPECLYKLDLDHKFDKMDKSNQFCLGTLAYELLTGKKLFPGENVAEILLERYNFFMNPAIRDEKLNKPRLTTRMKSILKKLLNFNPEKRYDDLPTALREIGKVRADFDKDEEIVFASYRRCLSHADNFIDIFYENLFLNPEMEPLKPKTNEERITLTQKFYIDVHLMFDVENTIEFLHKMATLEDNETNPISEYILFLNSFIKTIEDCDPRWKPNHPTVKAWNNIRERILNSIAAFLPAPPISTSNNEDFIEKIEDLNNSDNWGKKHKPLTKENGKNGENGKNEEDIVLNSLNNSDINIDSQPVDVESATTEIEVQYNPEKL